MTIFPAYCRSQGIPEPVTEYRFGAMASGGPGKGLRERLATTGLSDWRFDYAWPEHRIALEQEGGMFSGGHHARPTGIKRDIAKYNAAGSMGWIVLRCLPEDLLKLSTIELIRRTMEARKARIQGYATAVWEVAEPIAAERDEYRKALEWITNNPGAHPVNILNVASDALAKYPQP